MENIEKSATFTGDFTDLKMLLKTTLSCVSKKIWSNRMKTLKVIWIDPDEDIHDLIDIMAVEDLGCELLYLNA